MNVALGKNFNQPIEPSSRNLMEAAKIRIRSGVAIDFVYRDPDEGISAQVDCRLLFMGANFFAVRRAYAEAIRLFEGGHSRAELSKRLAESPEIQRHYESVERDGKVSITMREATFREPGPLEGIEFLLRITRAACALIYIRWHWSDLRRSATCCRCSKAVARWRKFARRSRGDCRRMIARGRKKSSDG